VSASSLESVESPGLTAPRLRRRLATMLYEGVILFGIVFIAGYLFSTLTQQRNGLTHHNLLMAWIGFVLAGYFVYFWTHGGQTLPMKTWRLKVVDARGAPVSTARAFVRYVSAGLWVLLPLALHTCLNLSLRAFFDGSRQLVLEGRPGPARPREYFWQAVFGSGLCWFLF